ncbi:hypothetical protein M0811_07405 [Anaeramoeba ignava]|uniref:Uncharacterized protein n=1 Tax=Anaeramoeba ignava TaxID=1746090 RepID=A0A9Q0LPA8_ANAIG|nr:hypothetical protein M0811_07405 [Anaeramoeba ignava]
MEDDLFSSIYVLEHACVYELHEVVSFISNRYPELETMIFFQEETKQLLTLYNLLLVNKREDFEKFKNKLNFIKNQNTKAFIQEQINYINDPEKWEI